MPDFASHNLSKVTADMGAIFRRCCLSASQPSSNFLGLKSILKYQTIALSIYTTCPHKCRLLHVYVAKWNLIKFAASF